VVTDREWREASDMRQSRITLLLILLVAAGLRFWAIDSGIPFSPQVDEPELMERSVRMMRTGDFNPRFYDYPGFYIHLQMVVAVLRFLFGATVGEWGSLAETSTFDFYVWGRALTALIGTATVLVLYHVGMRWGTRYAALGSGLLAVMPMHVRESHFVLTDVPVTFFVALAWLMALRAHEQPRIASFAIAGAAAGLAAATKYPGALAVTLALFAVWMTPAARPSRLTAALVVCVSSMVAFLVAAPYTVLDLPGFLNGYAKLAGYYSGNPPVEPVWLTYLKHLRLALAWPGFLLALAGFTLAVVRSIKGTGRARWALIVIFPLLYFLFVSRQTLAFGRYLMPMVPFACLLASVAVVSGVSLLRRFDIPRAARTALVATLTVAAILPPALQAVSFDIALNQRSTTELAYDWILENIPRGSKVAIETQQLLLPPNTYQGVNMPRLVADHRSLGDHQAYVDKGFQFAVASSAGFSRSLARPDAFPAEYEAYMKLFTLSEELVRFTPDKDHPGPEIRILRLKSP
jgi:4-amino-4-deoxy-L-arabinose transferase-like glycosyltransferase